MVMDQARFRASQQAADSVVVSYRQYTGLCVQSQMGLGITSLGQRPNLSEILPVKCE